MNFYIDLITRNGRFLFEKPDDHSDHETLDTSKFIKKSSKFSDDESNDDNDVDNQRNTKIASTPNITRRTRFVSYCSD